MEWELAVVEELHTRLDSKGLQMWTVRYSKCVCIVLLEKLSLPLTGLLS